MSKATLKIVQTTLALALLLGYTSARAQSENPNFQADPLHDKGNALEHQADLPALNLSLQPFETIIIKFADKTVIYKVSNKEELSHENPRLNLHRHLDGPLAKDYL